MTDTLRKNATNTRGRPFKPGNAGRPKGARNRATVAAEALLDGQAEALTRKAIERALDELLRNVGDGRGQAASDCWLTVSMPSMNFTPVISFGNWLWPSRRRQLFSAACASLKTMAIAVLFERHPLERTVRCRTVANVLSMGLVTGMKIAVPTCSAGIGLVPAYGATIRDEGHWEHAEWAGRCAS